MTSFYPRTANVIVDSLALYKTVTRRHVRPPADEIVRLAGQHSSADAQLMCEKIAEACIRAFDRAVATEPVLPKHLREEVYNWLALMPGFGGDEKNLRKELEAMLERKVERGLL
jgi:hypothetical protein